MIEIVSNEVSKSSLEQKVAPKLPKNVKQVGETDGNVRIYLEDYVMTYITNAAKKKKEKSCAGILLGESKEFEGVRYNFINAGMEIAYEGEFNAELWREIYEDKNKHFPQKDIIGWYLIEDEVTKNEMLDIERMHLNNFAGSEKCLFLMQCECMDGDFYLYENRCLKKLTGYNIYYEKNELMQEFMISDSKGVSVDETLTDRVTTSFREIINSKNENKHYNYTYAVSSFLAVVIIVIGINMINSYEKLENLDYMINNISNKVSDIKNDYGNVTPVVNLPGLVEPQSEEYQSETPSEEATKEPSEAATKAPSEEATQAPSEEATEAPSEEATQASNITKTHVVIKGESIYSIARKYYGSDFNVETILEINNIKDPDKIYPGQTIKLP
ncbi:MAG: LysM peptidoglycan-binding domain-containing protein [Lachnospira sp.]|nr:LysM peptidoglycan-binding domain-containing protein [Lachnospira sp.]